MSKSLSEQIKQVFAKNYHQWKKTYDIPEPLVSMLQADVLALVDAGEKKLRELDTEKWIDEHEEDMFNNYPPIRDARAFKFEDMLRYFIETELLGKKFVELTGEKETLK